MSLGNCLEKARELRRQGCSNDEILRILKQYCETANEADRALKELQKEERNRFNPRDF